MCNHKKRLNKIILTPPAAAGEEGPRRGGGPGAGGGRASHFLFAHFVAFKEIFHNYLMTI